MADDDADAAAKVNHQVFLGGFRFRVWVMHETWGSDVNQNFVKCSGIVSESEVMEFMQGTDYSVSVAPGRSRFADIQLERVYQGTDSFYRWRNLIESGTLETANVKVELQNNAGDVIRTMIIEGAWPKRWEMPDLDAGGSSPAIERITLACALVREDSPGT